MNLLSVFLFLFLQIPRYDRGIWMPPGWEDSDGDCQNTRVEVLLEEAEIGSAVMRTDCDVQTGLWYDPYTGKKFTDPRKLDIDHLVPLSEAHRSGGWEWPQEKKRQYANFLGDSDHLIAVDASANRKKGDKDPALWLPPNKEFHCEYIRRWVSIKTRWNLSQDSAELSAIEKIQTVCAGKANDANLP